MANHVLSLEIPTVTTSCVLKIFDTSVYSSQVGIFNPRLYITVPGFSNSVELSFVPNSTPSITTCDLNIQTENCDQSYQNLPDGIYNIKYIVDASGVVYVEYNHLRITHALGIYERLLCDVDVADCDPPQSVKDKLRELQLIKMYLDAAKAKVETCHESQPGMTLYNYALKLLNKLDCKHC
tara:strand:+ start:195 stop:737 length:543 start_codon:yes stop_codon:yes gene_type:complete